MSKNTPVNESADAVEVEAPEAVEAVEVEETPAPEADPEPEVKVDNRVALSPTRSRINAAKPEDNPHFNADLALYVTRNEAGRERGLLADQGTYAVGDTFEAILGARKASLGTLTIVGVVADGEKDGEVPEKNLPLRILA